VTAKWECAQASPEDGALCAAETAEHVAACAERIVAQVMRGFETAATDANPQPSRLPPPHLAMAGEHTGPHRGAGYRAVQVSRGGALAIEGSDATTKAVGKHRSLKGRAVGIADVVDFSPKGGPKDLTAKFDGSGLAFPDGNR
jgi:hypothetical protein